MVRFFDELAVSRFLKQAFGRFGSYKIIQHVLLPLELDIVLMSRLSRMSRAEFLNICLLIP